MSDHARSILIVLHDLPLGGTERIAIRLANRWAAAGRKVILLCGSRRGTLADMIGPGVEVVECSPAIPRGPGSRKALGKAVCAFIRRRRPEVLFIPGNYHWPVQSALAELPKSVRPAVISQISTPLYRHGRGPAKQVVYNLKTRAQFRTVDAAIALSPATVPQADRVLGRRITQSIPLPALDDATQDLPRTRAEGRTILAAGRLVPEKGFDVAIKAFALLGDPDSCLVILGEGPQRAELTRLAHDLGVGHRVDMPGYVRDVRPWLQVARTFLLTSWYEGYAAVIVEALGAGRPVVATDCTPAAAELLSRSEAGAVAPIGDYAGLAEGLRAVMSAEAPCPEMLAQSVARYRIGPIAEAYLDLFDATAAARGAQTVYGWVRDAARRPSGLRAWRPATAIAGSRLAASRRSA